MFVSFLSVTFSPGIRSGKVRRQILGTQGRLDIFSPFRSQAPKGGWMSSLSCSASTSIYRRVGLLGRQPNYGSPEMYRKCALPFFFCALEVAQTVSVLIYWGNSVWQVLLPLDVTVMPLQALVHSGQSLPQSVQCCLCSPGTHDSLDIIGGHSRRQV